MGAPASDPERGQMLRASGLLDARQVLWIW
jgi:hypothetical protein